MEYINGLLEFKRKYIAKNWNRVPTDGEIQSLLDFKKRTFWNTNAGAVFLPDVTKNNCYSYDRYLKKFFKGKVIFDNKSELGFYIDDFSETKRKEFKHRTIIEKDLFDEYVKKYKTEKGILLKRVLYGIIAKK
jgi:hypothetical protein